MKPIVQITILALPIVPSIVAYSMQLTKADNMQMEQKRSAKGREKYRVSLISSNLHSSQLQNRCWTIVLNFNIACDSFDCESYFRKRADSTQAGRKIVLAHRDAFTHLVTNNPFPIPRSKTRSQANVRCIGEKAFCRQLLSIWMM